MSVQLLDRTRKIKKLLHNSSSSKVVFNDICQVLMETLSSNILVLSKKGKVLGVSLCPGRNLRIKNVRNAEAIWQKRETSWYVARKPADTWKPNSRKKINKKEHFQEAVAFIWIYTDHVQRLFYAQNLYAFTLSFARTHFYLFNNNYKRNIFSEKQR